MSHQITKRDSLFYAGAEVPWHGIGRQVGDVLTASEAIIASGLSWKVLEEPVLNKDGQKIDGYKAVVREDTNEVLQIATERYFPVQNVDCFQIFDEVTGTGQAKYEVAGSLKGGRIIWILARLPFDFAVAGDEVRSYLLLTTSHDGSLAWQMFKTPIRVVCWNTLSAGLDAKEKGKVAYFKHTPNFRARVGKAQEILSESKAYFDAFKEQSEVLARKQMSGLAVDAFLATLFKTEGKAEDEVTTRTKNAKIEITRLFETGKGNQQVGVRGTAWALYNGVTEYVDHKRTTKGNGSNRLCSSWFGSGKDMREVAHKELLTIAKA